MLHHRRWQPVGPVLPSRWFTLACGCAALGCSAGRSAPRPCRSWQRTELVETERLWKGCWEKWQHTSAFQHWNYNNHSYTENSLRDSCVRTGFQSTATEEFECVRLVCVSFILKVLVPAWMTCACSQVRAGFKSQGHTQHFGSIIRSHLVWCLGGLAFDVNLRLVRTFVQVAPVATSAWDPQLGR